MSLQMVVIRLSFGGVHSWLSFGCHSVGGSQLVVVRLSFGGGVTAGCRSVVIQWGFTAGCRSVVIRWGVTAGCRSVVIRWGGGHSWLSFGCHSVGGVTAGCRSVVIR